MVQNKIDSIIEQLFQKSVNDKTIQSVEEAEKHLDEWGVDPRGHLRRRLLRGLKKELQNVSPGSQDKNVSSDTSKKNTSTSSAADKGGMLLPSKSSTSKAGRSPPAPPSSKEKEHSTGDRDVSSNIASEESNQPDVIYISSGEDSDDTDRHQTPYYGKTRGEQRPDQHGKSNKTQRGKGSKRQPLSKQQVKAQLKVPTVQEHLQNKTSKKPLPRNGKSSDLPSGVKPKHGNPRRSVIATTTPSAGGRKQDSTSDSEEEGEIVYNLPSTSNDTSREPGNDSENEEEGEIEYNLPSTSKGITKTSSSEPSHSTNNDKGTQESESEEGEVVYTQNDEGNTRKRKAVNAQPPVGKKKGPKRMKKYPFKYNRANAVMSEDTYVLQKVQEKRYRSYTAIDTTYNVKLNQDWEGKKFSDLLDDFYKMFSKLLTQTRHRTQKIQGARNYARVIIHHKGIANDIVVPLIKLHLLHPGLILETIQNTLNSNENLSIDHSFGITIGTVQNLSGRGRIHPTNEVNLDRKTSIKIIKNKDNLCFQRAIAVGWAHLTRIPKKAKHLWKQLKTQIPGRTNLEKSLYLKRVPHSYYKDILRDDRNDQKNLALALAKHAKVPINRAGCMDDIEKYEKALNIQIAVISREYGNRFITPKKEGPKIYLYHNHNHFDVILSPTGFFNSSYFCPDCDQPFSDFKSHTCHRCCAVCHNTECQFDDTAKGCSSCNRFCRSEECHKRHVEKGLCSKFWQCPDCKKIVRTDERDPEKHNCSEQQCFSCKEFVLPGHKCYMRANIPKISKLKLMVFDYECRQDEDFECDEGYIPKNPTGEGCRHCSDRPERCPLCSACKNCGQSNCGAKKHQPNLVIAQTVCDFCVNNLETDFETKCPECGSRCEKCSEKEGDEYTREFCEDTCGHRVKCFKGDNCGDDFAKWLFSDIHKDFVALSHYGRNYDNYFILNYLLSNGMPPENTIYSGSKVMSMTVRKGINIKFLDSFNFISTKLSSLPKTFGFDEKIKGWFPHFFNLVINQNYVGKYPDKEFYGPEFMSPGEKAEFDKWYDELPLDAVFNFQEEIVKYCKMDTDILLIAAVEFRKIIMGITQTDSLQGIDPYQYTTLASLCMAIFKTYYLQEKWLVDIVDITGEVVAKDQVISYKGGAYTKDGEIIEEGTIKKKKFLESPLAYIPANGYTKTDQYSAESIYYMEWVRHRRKVEVQHALNLGEKRVKIGTSWYRFDGFIPDKTGRTKGRVIEYHGCAVHGCKICYSTNRKSTKSPFTNETIEQLYQKTMRKRRDLIVHGYGYEHIWGCQYAQMLKENKKFKSFVDGLKKSEFVTPRLQPKDAFYGGRVDTSKLFYEVKEDEEIHYFDVTSLYPYVNKYAKYPKGHPEIITSDFKEISQYFGIAKVKIQPPYSLYHPVLPVRSNGKLKFPLCAKCAKEENQSLCQCSDEERAIVGTWTTLEIEKAIEKGYKLIRIYELYHWKETMQFNPETGENGLFSEYVNAVLKIKQESSGYPDECEKDGELQEKYIKDYFEHENIVLNPDKIKKNPGLRSVAKLLANSLWGKFCQRLNLKQTKFITENECDKFMKYMTDPTINISNFHIVSDKVIQLEYSHNEDFVPESVSTNIFVGVFTTSHARLELYNILDFLDGRAGYTQPVGDQHVIEGLRPERGSVTENLSPSPTYPTRVLYYDTDSVIFTTKKGQKNPPLGNYLGQLTDEAPGVKIVKFISAGPKVYAYRTSDGADVCKIRGFTLNVRNESVINLDSLEKIVKGWNSPLPPLVTSNPSKITRDKKTCSIISKLEEKRFKMVYTKRVIKPDFDTVPYGYR